MISHEKVLLYSLFVTLWRQISATYCILRYSSNAFRNFSIATVVCDDSIRALLAAFMRPPIRGERQSFARRDVVMIIFRNDCGTCSRVSIASDKQSDCWNWILSDMKLCWEKKRVGRSWRVNVAKSAAFGKMPCAFEEKREKANYCTQDTSTCACTVVRRVQVLVLVRKSKVHST